MYETFFKYFSITGCTLFIYGKILHLKYFKLVYLLFPLFISAIICFLKSCFIYATMITIPLLIVFSCIFYKAIIKKDMTLTVTVVLLSYGISYAAYTISTILVSALISLIKLEQSLRLLHIIFLITMLQLLLIILLFKPKRLKKGMPFLYNKNAKNWGTFIGVMILNNILIVSNDHNKSFVRMVAIFSVFLCAIFIFYWWYNRINKIYLERVKENELNDLKNTLTEKDSMIKKLEDDNDSLARIIHRDNKMIPAMEFALRNYLHAASIGSVESVENAKEQILNQLKIMSQERIGIIRKYELQKKNLPLTNIPSIDILLFYLSNKAKEKNINFDFIISGDIRYVIMNLISEKDLNTLFADLIDNAITATNKCTYKNILVNVGKTDNCIFVDIIDSGIHFKTQTLLNLGIKPTTTHQHDGGSGIGFMTTFQLLNKYKASFMIDEIYNKNSIFTKKLTIKFDKRKQYILKTNRVNEIKALAERKDLIIIAN